MITQVDVETQILRVINELEDETDRYAELEDRAGEAEADYKGDFAKALLQVAATGDKITAGEREARATKSSIDTFRAWKIEEGRRRASKEYLLTLRAKLDALRSLSANVRAQT